MLSMFLCSRDKGKHTQNYDEFDIPQCCGRIASLKISWEADLLRPSLFSLRSVRARSSSAFDIPRIVDQLTVAVNFSRNPQVELFMSFY